MDKDKQPVRQSVFEELLKDFIVALITDFVFSKFNGLTAALLLGFILLVIAPKLGMGRIPLVSITFLTIGKEILADKKTGQPSEAIMFFVLVGICILIDEIIRFWKNGFSGLQICMPIPPFMRNVIFSIFSTAILYSYSIYEYQKHTGSIFDSIGSVINTFFKTALSGSTITGTNTGLILILIIIITTSIGTTISMVLFDGIGVLMGFFSTILGFLGAIFIGMPMAVIILLPIEIIVKLTLGSNASYVYEPVFWLVLHLSIASGASLCANGDIFG